jgi:hypothetical protein
LTYPQSYPLAESREAMAGKDNWRNQAWVLKNSLIGPI